MSAQSEPDIDPAVTTAMTTPRMVFDNPCDADLDSMPSFDEGRRRFCAQCMRSVHMLSDMTRSEAQAFIDQNRGECMSYRRGDDGRIVFRPERRAGVDRAALPRANFVPRARLSPRRRSAIAAAPVLAALVGCGGPAELEAPLEIEDAQAQQLTHADSPSYVGYQALPDETPCDPPPVVEAPPRKRNNEALVNMKLPEFGNPGHYAGGMSYHDIQLPDELARPSFAQLRLASVEVSGADETILRRIVRQRTNQVRSCLERSGLGAGEDLELRFVIDATGRVLSSHAQLATGTSVACVAERIAEWTFPEPDSPSASVVVRYTS